jgi:hypothetical protein
MVETWSMAEIFYCILVDSGILKYGGNIAYRLKYGGNRVYG